MKRTLISLLLVCLAISIQAQIVARPPGGGNYKPMINKDIITSFLGDREKIQLLQSSPTKPEGMSNATSLGTKSTIGICTSENPAMTSSGLKVGEVNKFYMSIAEGGWLCLDIGGVEKGYYAIEVNLLEGGVKEFYIAPAPLALLTDMIKISRSNNKLVFMKELQGGVVNKIFIYTTDRSIQSSFSFTNAQVSRVNL